MELIEFWAKTKPFQSVTCHCMVSGHVAQVLLEQFMSEGDRDILSENLGLKGEELLQFVGYLVSLHDIGKLEYSFQHMSRDVVFLDRLSSAFPHDPTMPSVRHEKTGQKSLFFFWKERGENKAAARLFSKLVGAHHQGKMGSDNFTRHSQWFSYQQECESMMREHFLGDRRTTLPSMDRVMAGPVSVLLLGIMILSDWISSGVMFADSEEWIRQEGAKERIKKLTGEFLLRSNLAPMSPVKWPDSFCGVWPNIPFEGRRPLQAEMEKLFSEMEGKPLLVLLEAPMGEGKTECGVYAGLRMAEQWGKNGCYIAMPTAATANQMIGRIRALMEMHQLSSKVRLLHSMAWLEKTEDPALEAVDDSDEVASWLAPLKRGLLAQYAVGTVDQAMFAATNVKYGTLRLLGLSNKALIIDEIHSYDAYMSEIIVRLLEWCRALRIPVVLMSATIPPSLKRTLLRPYHDGGFSDVYPAITVIDDQGEIIEREIPTTTHRLEVSVNMIPYLGKPDLIAEAGIKMVEHGGCLCILMNTVREAQEVYQAVKQGFTGDCLLFHARFPAGRRAEIERECIRRYGKDKSHRPERSILVATQVVEQSLDVDFDAMMTAIAPIDLLLQRTGRIHRHEDTLRPEAMMAAVLTVLVPEEGQGYGPSGFVYPDCLLESSKRLINGRDSIRIPEDLAKLVRDGYDEEMVPEEEKKAWIEKMIQDQVKAGSSQQYLLNPPDKYYSALEGFVPFEDDEEAYQASAKTRLGEPSVRIALLSPELMSRVRPFISSKNEMRKASVLDHEVAELVMMQSVSVRVKEVIGPDKNLPGIKGAALLMGMRLLETMDGYATLANGKRAHYDNELGLLIEGGEP